MCENVTYSSMFMASGVPPPILDVDSLRTRNLCLSPPVDIGLNIVPPSSSSLESTRRTGIHQMNKDEVSEDVMNFQRNLEDL